MKTEKFRNIGNFSYNSGNLCWCCVVAGFYNHPLDDTISKVLKYL